MLQYEKKQKTTLHFSGGFINQVDTGLTKDFFLKSVTRIMIDNNDIFKEIYKSV